MLTRAEFETLSQAEKLRRYKELSYRDQQYIQMTCDPGGHRGICNFCRHYIGLAKCAAFPNGIPKELLLQDSHDAPFPGDNGYRFEPKD